ncbi:hypothetical protein C8J57DRAFT_1229596 [Mycena rebaudengoi]|nr:hypothetical protein C8J57DRAFT_1229596 [Mycena rebaudengoi]
MSIAQLYCAVLAGHLAISDSRHTVGLTEFKCSGVDVRRAEMRLILALYRYNRATGVTVTWQQAVALNFPPPPPPSPTLAVDYPNAPTASKLSSEMILYKALAGLTINKAAIKHARHISSMRNSNRISRFWAVQRAFSVMSPLP